MWACHHSQNQILGYDGRNATQKAQQLGALVCLFQGCLNRTRHTRQVLCLLVGMSGRISSLETEAQNTIVRAVSTERNRILRILEAGVSRPPWWQFPSQVKIFVSASKMMSWSYGETPCPHWQQWKGQTHEVSLIRVWLLLTRRRCRGDFYDIISGGSHLLIPSHGPWSFNTRPAGHNITNLCSLVEWNFSFRRRRIWRFRNVFFREQIAWWAKNTVDSRCNLWIMNNSLCG